MPCNTRLSRALGRQWRVRVSALFAVLALSVGVAGADDDYVYQVTRGDTLIGLTRTLLKNPADWGKVAAHNRMKSPNVITPGQRIRVPFSLLNSALMPAEVVHVEGEVKSAQSGGIASVLALGAKLAEGASVETGKNGYATLKLHDGSTVQVRADTRVQVEKSRSYAGVGIFDSLIKLASGRVESTVQKSNGLSSRQAIETPLATLSVRGTHYRATMDGQSRVTRGEVTEGAVVVAGAVAGQGEGKSVSAGFGTVVDAARRVTDPVALLSAPDIAKLPALQERPLLRFSLPEVAGASAYRAQVSRDEAFNAVINETLSKSPDVRVAGIADGHYYLKVRAIDALGLEGRDATHVFTLKARPEPPLVSIPASKGKVRATEVEFRWAENVEAATYHLQVAKDAGFKQLVHEDKAIQGPRTVSKMPLGHYFWRVASLRKDGDRGPYGDVAIFTLMAPPAAPEPPSMDDKSVSFRWAGEPGQKFAFQLSSDDKFSKLVSERVLDVPEIALPKPAPGTYFVRYRATDPDGFVGPYASVQRLVITAPPPLPPCLKDSAGSCVGTSYGIVGVSF